MGELKLDLDSTHGHEPVVVTVAYEDPLDAIAALATLGQPHVLAKVAQDMAAQMALELDEDQADG